MVSLEWQCKARFLDSNPVAECGVSELVDSIAPNRAVTGDVVGVEVEIINMTSALGCLEEPKILQHILLTCSLYGMTKACFAQINAESIPTQEAQIC